MKKSVFLKIFFFLTVVGVAPLVLALSLEYKNIYDLSQELHSMPEVDQEIIEKVDLVIADTKILIVLIFFFTIILVVLMSTVLSRKMTSPLRKLIDASNKISQGRFSTQVKIESGDEFEVLGRAFNKMAKDLKSYDRDLNKALEASRQSQKVAEGEREKTKMTLDNLRDGLMVLDEENKIEFLNPQGEKILGVKSSQVNGKGLSDLRKFPKLGKLNRSLNKKIKNWQDKKELYLEDPLKKFFEVSEAVMKDKESGERKRIITLHDITREKGIERMKNEFISIAAHQLRTPLSAIKWSLEFLEDELKKKLGEDYSGEIEDYLEKNISSNERMISLVNDLLNVSRIEEGRFIYQTKKISLPKLLREVIEQSSSKVKNKNIKLKITKLPNDLPEVKVDEEKVKLAIQNLVDNAIKYSFPKGRVLFRFRKIKEKRKTYVQLEVEDNGMGISLEDQEKIFLKFSRGNNAMKSQTEGSGLGLFIAKNIAEAHQGDLWFESSLNKGSIFYLRLPTEKK